MIAVCETSQVPPGAPLRVDVPELGPLAVIAHEGAYYVIQDTCTHGAASLSEGELIDEEIECPFHKGAFSFITGLPTARPCTIPLRVYHVEVTDGMIFISPDPIRR